MKEQTKSIQKKVVKKTTQNQNKVSKSNKKAQNQNKVSKSNKKGGNNVSKNFLNNSSKNFKITNKK